MTTHACDTLRCMTNPEAHAAVNALADAAATAQSDLAHTTGETRNALLEALDQRQRQLLEDYQESEWDCTEQRERAVFLAAFQLARALR